MVKKKSPRDEDQKQDPQEYDQEQEQYHDDDDVIEEPKMREVLANLTPRKKLFVLLTIVGAIVLLWFLFSTDDHKENKKRSDSKTTASNINNSKEGDKIINNVVDAVGADTYANIGELPKPDLPDKPEAPPPLIIPNIPEPALLQNQPPAPSQPTVVLTPPVVPETPVLSSTILAPPTIPYSSPNTSDQGLVPFVTGSDSSSNNKDNGRNSNMIAFGGGGGGGGGSGMGAGPGQFMGGIDPSNPLAGAKGMIDSMTTKQQVATNDSLPPAQTTASQVMATAYGHLDTMIAAGTIMDVVLETAINTSLSGTIRAVVSRNVYSAGGNNVLIPKGSRAIGQYAMSGNTVSSRLDIMWTRIMRSDGIDILVDAKATDSLGRNGAEGDVNLKIVEAIRNALLVSSITVAAAAAAQKIVGDDNVISETRHSDGQVSVVSKPVDSAVKDAAQQISQTLSDAVKKTTSSQSVISIDQGTKLKVFVNQDVIFSRGIANINKVQ